MGYITSAFVHSQRTFRTVAIRYLALKHRARFRAHTGKGSATRRAVELRGIDEQAAPALGIVNAAASLDVMRAVRNIVPRSKRTTAGWRRCDGGPP